MPQSIWVLTLLLVAFTVAGVKGKLASEATNSFLASYNTSSSSSSHKYSKELIKSLERRLLTMLGLPDRPKTGNNVSVPPYMWELYKKRIMRRKSSKSQRSNTVRYFTGDDMDHPEPHTALYKFNISALPNAETIWAAELVIRTTPPRTLCNSHPGNRVQVHDVVKRISQTGGSNPIFRLLDSRHVHAKNSTASWHTFDVLPAINRWLQAPSTNHGLLVGLVTAPGSSAESHHIRLKRDIGESREQWLENQPLLVIHSSDGTEASISVRHQSRRRRSTRKHRRKGRRDTCRRHSLYVDFSDVGWDDWIVAPPGYDAYHCAGVCPFPLADHLNTTNHAIVQTLVHSVNPTAVPKACCIPTLLSAIAMLYVDEYDKVVLKTYKDMVVEGCGCR